MRFFLLNLGLWLWIWGHPTGLLACRYNVLEVGFMDLDPEPYRIYVGVREETPSNDILALEETAREVLADSNIHLEIVNVDRQPSHWASGHFNGGPPGGWPRGILRSPDGHSLVVDLPASGAASKSKLTSAWRQMVGSPMREELVKKASQAFAVVLFIEGPQANENRRVRQAIAGAIEQIRDQMNSLPKAISQPPVMATLESTAWAREKILLWSLGIESFPLKHALAAIIYGRARWIGPLMKGEEITERNLTGMLSIVGADCECGLDLSWTQGTRLPVRWDDQQQLEVARRMGFDPESPLVKIEVSRILGQRGGSPKRFLDEETPSFELDEASGASITVSNTRTKTPVAERPFRGAPTPLAVPHEEGDLPTAKSQWPFLLTLSTVILITGLGIWLHTAGRR